MNTEGFNVEETEVVENNSRPYNYSPVELEAIAKVSRVVAELNRILADQDHDTIRIEWRAAWENTTVAEPHEVYEDTVAFS